MATSPRHAAARTRVRTGAAGGSHRAGSVRHGPQSGAVPGAGARRPGPGTCGNLGDNRLRVLLTVEDEGLRPLRWERLCAPFDGGWDLLALNHAVPYSLYLPSITDRRFPPMGRRDLRALIVAASPAGLEQYRLAPFDVTAAVAGVRDALGEISSDVLASDAKVTEMEGTVGPATFGAVAEQITAGTYTLLHLVGHGSVARMEADKQETALYLAKPDGRSILSPGPDCCSGSSVSIRGRGFPALPS